MKKLLLLHYHCDYSSNDVWLAAIRNGYATERIHDENIGERSKDFKFVRYYGNTLQAERVGNKFPFSFFPLSPNILAETPLTKRSVKLARFGDLPEIMTKRLFIKPVHQKYFDAKIYEIGEKIDAAQLPNDLIYIQEPVNILDEVRCFCLDGEILTASYYRKNKEFELENIDDNIPTKLRYMVAALYMYHDLPPGCVLDFGVNEKGEWLFIEPNEAWASGIYNCDPNKCLEAIVGSQHNK